MIFFNYKFFLGDITNGKKNLQDLVRFFIAYSGDNTAASIMVIGAAVLSTHYSEITKKLTQPPFSLEKLVPGSPLCANWCCQSLELTKAVTVRHSVWWRIIKNLFELSVDQISACEIKKYINEFSVALLLKMKLSTK